MKLKRVLALALAGTMTVSLAACGGNSGSGGSGSGDANGGSSSGGTQEAQNGGADESSDGLISYVDLDLDKDYKDLTATISFFNNRTDMDAADYPGKNWEAYLADFNELYPNITVEIRTSTDYDGEITNELPSGQYETVTCIRNLDKADLPVYYMSYGDYDTISQTINYADNSMYQNQVYGIASTANAGGVVYNKKVFEQAGITELPKTPDEFLAALQKIKDNCPGVDPLYTNYSDGWALSGQWDAYIGIAATGDPKYKNQKLARTENPFKDYGDNTHAYAVYKILYDAVAQGLTEEDYSTTNWEACKPRMNNGEIGCMVLGSWALPQMKIAGDNPDDVGYMAFPISVDGKQYAAASADGGYGINVNATDDEKKAALVFVKWLVERSGYAYNEYSLPVVKGAETQLSFDGVEMITEEPALEGEEDLLNAINSESEVNIDQDGNGVRLSTLIEHAANGDMTYDEIVAEWNQAWSDAQESEGVEVTEQ